MGFMSCICSPGSSFNISIHTIVIPLQTYAEFRSFPCKEISSKHVERQKACSFCCEFSLTFSSVTVATCNPLGF